MNANPYNLAAHSKTCEAPNRFEEYTWCSNGTYCAKDFHTEHAGEYGYINKTIDTSKTFHY